MRRWWIGSSFRGLRVQILFWTILPAIILVIAFLFTGVRQHQNAMRTMVAERDAGLAQALADSTTALLARYTSSLQALATAIALQGNNSQTWETALAKMQDDLPELSMAVVAANGEVRAGLRPLPAWAEEIVQSLAVTPFSDSAPLVGTNADGNTITWTVLLSDGESWLLAGLPLTALPLSQQLNVSHLGSTGVAILTNGEKVLFANGRPLANEPAWQWPGVAQALAGESGVTFVADSQGENVIAYAAVPGPGWALVIREAWQPLVAPLLRLDKIMPFILLMAGATSLVTIFFGVNYIVRPLQQLGQQASRIGTGDFAVVHAHVRGVREIEDLGKILAQMAQQVQHYQSALQAFLANMTRTLEEERARLARELHDETVQFLIALGQQVQMAQRLLERNPTAVSERLQGLRKMIAEAVEEVRRFSRALRPLYLDDLGLAPALEMLAHEAGATFASTGAARRLPAEMELALYRIAQEALSNARQHAQASRILVTLTFDEGQIVLHVEDNGRGFQPPVRLSELSHSGHFGLIGMYERAQLAGGQLSVQSTPGEGTAVEVRFPS